MKSFRAFFLFAAVVFALLALFAYARTAVSGVADLRVVIRSFTDRAFTYRRFKELEASLAVLRAAGTEAPMLRADAREGYVPAAVYASPPFNDRRTMIIDFGRDDGAREGMPVVLSDGSVAGKIIAVRHTQSEARTPFDGAWVSSVAVGSAGARAVLKGGPAPRLEFVPREAAIAEGDLVTNTSHDFPLGAPVGTVERAVRDEAGFWKEVLVKPFLAPDLVYEVRVGVRFP